MKKRPRLPQQSGLLLAFVDFEVVEVEIATGFLHFFVDCQLANQPICRLAVHPNEFCRLTVSQPSCLQLETCQMTSHTNLDGRKVP